MMWGHRQHAPPGREAVHPSPQAYIQRSLGRGRGLDDAPLVGAGGDFFVGGGFVDDAEHREVIN